MYEWILLKSIDGKKENIQFMAMLVHTIWIVINGAAEDPMENGQGVFLAGFQLVSGCYTINGPQGLQQ